MSIDFPISKLDKASIDKLFNDLPNALIIAAKPEYGVLDAFEQTIPSYFSGIEFIKPSSKGTVDEEKGSIGIEEIRHVQIMAARKHQSTQVICFTKADSMTKSAQNAFLKLLEEPADKTKFVLCSEYPNKLLPTVISRAQIFNLHNITKQQSIDFVEKLGVSDKNKINQIVYLANGLPKKLKKLSLDEDYFSVVSYSFKNAMGLLSSNPYQKIISLSKYKDDRDKAVLLVDDLLLILKNTISSKPEYSSIEKIDRLIACRDRLIRGGNVRLNLIAAML